MNDHSEFVDFGRNLWETHAQWWQDNFSMGVDPEYSEQILPLVASRSLGVTSVLEIGTGEGQVLRVISETARNTLMRAVGVDPSVAQLVVAKERSQGLSMIRAEASGLPFLSGGFDLVVACLVFEHIIEVDKAVMEVSRVLADGGRFLFLLNHPLLQTPGSGWIDDQILGEQYWRIGEYLEEDLTVEEVQKDIFIPFVHRPLSRYINAAAKCGLGLIHMDEPAPPPGFVAQAWEYERSVSIPRLLALEFRKLSQGPLS